MPQIENVAQIKLRTPAGGRPNGGKERQAVTKEYRPRYQKATRKEKKAVLDEFTRLTGYHRKSAVRLLGAKLGNSLKSRIPIRTFYTSEERRKPGFWQIDTVHHCGQ
ncbi:MAG: hypothetical protein FWB78_12180, partial [Treponema sp.]|nr:hypothetical protein [Treponema sp.]